MTRAQKLKYFVEQIEQADISIASLNADKTEFYKAAKQQGLSPKVLKRVVAERRKDPADRQESDALFRQYWDEVHSPVDITPEKEHAAARTQGKAEPPDPLQIDIEEAIAAATEAAE